MADPYHMLHDGGEQCLSRILHSQRHRLELLLTLQLWYITRTVLKDTLQSLSNIPRSRYITLCKANV